MLNRKNYTYKVCLCDGYYCDGHITVQANDEETAYDMAMDYVLNALAKALPELGIDVYIELEEEEEEEENAEDKEVEAMWNELEDVPIDENECLEVDWNGFSKGTHREEIWYWFDEHHSKGVGWLMNEYEG